jgi:3-phenylpropionate/trans-cinnamate dioxygenase ferredoxin reductase component
VAGHRFVIVGGGGAGDSAAFEARKEGFDGEIVIVSADADRPYDRPYLSKEFMRGEIEREKVFLHAEADYAKARIDLRQGVRVTDGDLGGRRLVLDDGTELEFDTLLLATGGTPRRIPNVPKADNVFTLRSLRDSTTIRDALQASGRLLLLGAGFIGAEVGASARTLGKEVLMVESAPVPLARALGEEVGKVYAGIHKAHGVDVRTGTTVDDWHSSGARVAAVTLSDGRREDVDLVLLGVGIDPNLELAAALGLPAEGGGVSVDEGLKAADGVYCGGDIANHLHPVLGRSLRVEHWEVAKGHGTTIGAAIAGNPRPHETLPYFWSDQYDVSLEYRGNASGDHELVWRGDREALKVTVFYLLAGVVDAVLSLNDGETNATAEALIKTRRPVDAAALADPSTDLAALAEAPA